MSHVTRPVLRSAVVGFCVPIFWGVLGFLYFSAPNSAWTDAFWVAVYISCPPWVLPENSYSAVLTPLLNAALYGAVCYAVILGKSALTKRRNPGAV